MTLEQLAYLAEVVGVVVIVITLILLVVQVRQGNATLRSAAAQGIQEQIATHYGLLISDPELTEVFIRGTRQPDQLTNVEMCRYMAWLTVAIQSFQSMYYQRLRGAYEPGMFDGFMRLFAGLSTTPGFQAFWSERKEVFSIGFQKYPESEVFSREDDGYQPLSVPHTERGEG